MNLNISLNRFTFILFYFATGLIFLSSYFFSGDFFSTISENGLLVFGAEVFSVIGTVPLILHLHAKGNADSSNMILLKMSAIFWIIVLIIELGLVFVCFVIIFQAYWIFLYFVISLFVKYFMLRRESSSKLLNKEFKFVFNSFFVYFVTMFLVVMFVEGDYVYMDDSGALMAGVYFFSFPIVEYLMNICFPKDLLIWKKKEN